MADELVVEKLNPAAIDLLWLLGSRSWNDDRRGDHTSSTINQKAGIREQGSGNRGSRRNSPPRSMRTPSWLMTPRPRAPRLPASRLCGWCGRRRSRRGGPAPATLPAPLVERVLIDPRAEVVRDPAPTDIDGIGEIFAMAGMQQIDGAARGFELGLDRSEQSCRRRFRILQVE